MENILERDVKKLAEEFHLSEKEVRDIYEEEKKKIASSAIFTNEFIPLVCLNKTRKKLVESFKKE